MSVGWVAGAIRGRALAGRTLGAESAEALAAKPSLEQALLFLSRSTYGHRAHAGMELEAAQRAVGETALWHLRVLAGWLPPTGVDFLRVLAAWFEMSNLEDRVVALAGRVSEKASPYRLGALATAWREAAATNRLSALSRVLAHSAWEMEARAEELPAILFWLRVSWARRLKSAFPGRPEWGDGALALAVAKALFVPDSGRVPVEAKDIPELGPKWSAAEGLGRFAQGLPSSARWVLRDTRGPEDLWSSERLWWVQVDREARRLLEDRSFGRSVVIGAAVSLVTDCWRTQASLQRAARGFGVEERARARA